MSQFARQLGLKISIDVQGVEKLTQVQQALRQQLAANVPFLRQTGQLKEAIDQLSRGATIFANTGAPLQATRSLTQMIAVQKQARAEEDAQEKQRVAGIITRARLLSSDGDQAKAINLLTLANDKYGKSAENRLKFENELSRVQRIQTTNSNAAAAALAKQESAIAAQAVLNAKKAGGDPNLQISLLSQAQGQVTPGSSAFNTLERGLISANDDLTRSAEKAAEAEKKKQDQVDRLQKMPIGAQNAYEQSLVSETRTVVGLALKYKDFEGALNKIEQARAKVRSGSVADMRLQQQAIEVAEQQSGQQGFLGKVGDAVGNGAAALRRFLATAFFVAYALKQVGGIIYTGLVQPIEQLATSTLEATDNFRRMTVTLSGVTGSLRSAKSLQEDIGKAGQGLPSTLLQQQEAIRGILFTPALARQAQQPGQGREDTIRSLLTTLQGLAIINPEQGLPGAQFAFREALAGQFRSTRTRFNISPQVVAAAINKTVADLEGDPSLVPKAFEAFVHTFIGPDTISEFQNLLSTQGQRFKGVMEEFFNLVGNEGVFDRVVGSLRKINDRIEAGVRAKPGSADDLRPVARQIDLALERVLDAIFKSVDNVVGAAIGRPVDIQKSIKAGDIQDLGKTVADFIGAISKMTAQIVLLLGDLLTIGAKIAHFSPGPGTAAETTVELGKDQARLALLQKIQTGIQSPAVTSHRSFMNPDGRSGRTYIDPDTGDPFTANFLSKQGLALGSRLSDEDLPTIVAGIANTERDIAALQRRLTLQRVAEGTTSPTQSGPSFLRQDISLRDSTNEGIARINTISADLDRHVQQIIEGPLQLAEKFVQIRKTISSDFDPGSPTSLLGAITRAQKFMDVNASDMRGSAAFLNEQAQLLSAGGDKDGAKAMMDVANDLLGASDRLKKAAADALKGTASSLREAQADLIEQFGKQAGSLPPAALLRESNQLFGSAVAQARIATGGAASGPLDRSGLSLLGTVPPGLESQLAGLGAFNFKPESVPSLARAAVSGVAARVELNQRKGLGAQGVISAGDQAREGLEALRKLINSPEYQKAENVGPETVATLNDVVDENLFHLQQEVRKSLEGLTQVVNQFASDISGAFKSGISDSLVDIFTNKGHNLKDIAHSFGISIGKAIADGLTEAIVVRGAVNPVLNKLFGLTGTSGALPESGLFGRQSSPDLSALVGDQAIATNAYGGYYPAPIATIPGYADGASLLTRTNGLISTPYGVRRTVEDGTPEAVVPIRGGGLPIRFLNGGMGGGPTILQVTMINSVNPGQIVADGVSARPGVVVNEVARDMRGRGVTSKTVRVLASRQK